MKLAVRKILGAWGVWIILPFDQLAVRVGPQFGEWRQAFDYALRRRRHAEGRGVDA